MITLDIEQENKDDEEFQEDSSVVGITNELKLSECKK